ncbi:hypothetical protein [Streptomyces sp. NPDC058295]|uniref:hypothetical protein n=1 Tax=Streptomyces sp. NPDC058295 TaxID=3346431 RepID=UPI0036E2D012
MGRWAELWEEAGDRQGAEALAREGPRPRRHRSPAPPGLADIQGLSVHEPWRLRGLDRLAAGDYPGPIVDLSDGLTRFKRARGLAEA